MKQQTMRTKGLIALALLLGMFFSVQAADHVRGNGKLTSKRITIDDFNAIKINDVIDFNYVQSESTPHIEVTVDENLHPYINIEIKDRVLTVNFKGAKVDHYTKFIVKANSRWLKEVRVNGNGNFMLNSQLTGDELKINSSANSLIQLKEKVEVGKLDLNVSGSANMVVNEVQTDKLECSISGSGTINVKQGTTEEADYNITSDGEIMAFGVAASKVDCKITGKGSAQVQATEKLKASVVGKGSIRYKGDAAIDQTILGKGTIEKAN